MKFSPRCTAIAEAMEGASGAVQSPLQRMEHALHPWVIFIVVPIFALANAAIDLTQVRWAGALQESVTLGVVLGLVLGKFAGIGLASWIAVRLGLARLPEGVAWRHLLGAAWLAGIGFTMSLFIAQLAFVDPVHIQQAKLGIVIGSFVSAIVGTSWLFIATRRVGAEEPAP